MFDNVHTHVHMQPSVEQIYIHTNSLCKEQASMREMLRAVNERNRRLEAELVRISAILRTQFGSSPNDELEL